MLICMLMIFEDAKFTCCDMFLWAFLGDTEMCYLFIMFTFVHDFINFGFLYIILIIFFGL